ncbi:L type [Durusdinium trenchii]|uniref:L type n=1 Tax=Durusdinium trenchii TaxID=1381693 RepID=A0ABP0MJ40_9DINO
MGDVLRAAPTEELNGVGAGISLYELHEAVEKHFELQGEQLQRISLQLEALAASPSAPQKNSVTLKVRGVLSTPGESEDHSLDVPQRDSLQAQRKILRGRQVSPTPPERPGDRDGDSCEETPEAPRPSPEAVKHRKPSGQSQHSQDSSCLPSLCSDEPAELSHRMSREKPAHWATTSTNTFVGQEVHRQQQSARMAARKLTDQKLSSVVYWSQRPKDNNVAYQVVSSSWFVYGISVVILINMILLGFEVNLAAAVGQESVPLFFGVANATAVGIFVIELMLSFIAFGIRRFFCGADRIWNLFDFCIITLSVLETATELWARATVNVGDSQVSTSQLRFFRSVRLARALRGVRMVRLLRYVGALRTLVLSIASSMASLLWTLVLLVLICYTFGIMFTQMVSDYCRYELGFSTMQSCTPVVGVYWSSLEESMLTLFMTISGGINWGETFRPLIGVGWFAMVCHIIFITIAVLAVVNVVTGVFCTTAMESAAADKEIATMKQLQKKNAQLQDLRDAFAEIVDSESNTVNIEDFSKAMSSARFRHFLESMSISTTDIDILFTIIDTDQSGLIDLEEFVQGCLQLHGPAKSLQLARMSFENKITRKAMKSMASSLLQLEEQLKRWPPVERAEQAERGRKRHVKSI